MREGLGAYTLGALADPERSAIRAHLAHCPACRHELTDLTPVGQLLACVDRHRFH
jgi:anti-sigma factor RsiW